MNVDPRHVDCGVSKNVKLLLPKRFGHNDKIDELVLEKIAYTLSKGCFKFMIPMIDDSSC